MDMESFAYRSPGVAEDGAPLSPLDWDGLLARLGAERDLRRELASRDGAAACGASFAAGAAWALDGSGQGKPGINSDALADGKAAGGITAASGTDTSAAGSDARGQK